MMMMQNAEEKIANGGKTEMTESCLDIYFNGSYFVGTKLGVQ
jgi:hypothetical protein